MRVRFAQAREVPGDGWRFRGLQKFVCFGGLGAPPTLRPGSSGQPVKDLQEMLNALGYNVPVTGTFDSVATLLSVTSFQEKNGLKPDGIVGPLTWAKLNPTYGGPKVAPVPVAKPSNIVIEPVGGFEPWMLGLGVALIGYAAYSFLKR